MLGDPANAKSPFFSVDINRICMRFHLCSFSRVFSNRHVFGEYAKRIPAYAVNGRPQRIEMCAFLNENVIKRYSA